MHRKVFGLLVIVCCGGWKPVLIVTVTILGFWCLYILILVNNIIGRYLIKFLQRLLRYIGEQRWDLVIRSSGCMIWLNTTKKVTNDNIPESRGEWSRALDVRLSEWCCSVSMVWVQIPSREEQKIDSSKI
jgi:hypothetical protein